MRGERGQATVEWIGTVLLVALALAALARVAGSTGDDAIASSVLSTMSCAARGDCEAKRPAAARTRPDPARTRPDPDRTRPDRDRTRPPGGGRGTAPLLTLPSRLRAPGGGQRVARGPVRLPDPGPVMRRLRKAGGVAWRRAWLACLAYERVRLGFEYPQLRFPGYTLPPEELVRVARTCVLPVDAFPEGDPPAIP